MDIELKMSRGVPLAAIIADSKLINNMLDNNNPWINTTEDVAEDGKTNMGQALRILRVCI